MRLVHAQHYAAQPPAKDTAHSTTAARPAHEPPLQGRGQLAERPRTAIATRTIADVDRSADEIDEGTRVLLLRKGEGAARSSGTGDRGARSTVPRP